MSQEIRMCLDCLLTNPVDVHGRCPTCGSEAVVFPEHIRPFIEQRDKSIFECERIFALPAESSGRFSGR